MYKLVVTRVDIGTWLSVRTWLCVALAATVRVVVARNRICGARARGVFVGNLFLFTYTTHGVQIGHRQLRHMHVRGG